MPDYDYSAGALDRLNQLKNDFGIDYTYVDNPGLRTWGSDKVPVYDGQVFTLRTSKGENLYQGVGPEGLAEATRLSQNLGGGWMINGSVPYDPTAVKEAYPSWMDKKKIANAPDDATDSLQSGMTYASKSPTDFDPAIFLGALPFAAAVAAPALGAALGGGGGAGAGAAGSLASSSLGGAAASGAASGLGAGLAGAGAAGLGAAALPAFEGITVLGGVGGGLGAAGTAGLGAAAAGGAAALGGGGGGAGAGGFDGITVTGAPAPAIDPSWLAGLDFGGLTGATAGLGGSPATPAPEPEIVVEGSPQPPPLDLGLPIDLAALGAAATVPLASGAGAVTQPPPAKSTLDKIVDYLQVAGLGTGLLGNLLGGGGGSGGNGTVPGGLGGDLNPIFNKPLPAPTGPAANLGQRTMPVQDWTRYGTRPEQSFFNAVPQGYTPPAAGTLDPQWDKERNFAVGGEVNGQGTGRSDSIKARLSDGEYVIDAETVALLGDGSSKAGADKLDDFRIALRKDKGRDLAKGKFSGAAKSPQRYMGDK